MRPPPLLLILLTRMCLCQQRQHNNYVPLNSLTIASLLRDDEPASSKVGATASAEATAEMKEDLQDYKPWWNTLQEERTKRRRTKNKRKQKPANSGKYCTRYYNVP